MKLFKHPLILVLLVVGALAIVLMLVRNKAPVDHAESRLMPVVVETMTLARSSFHPRAVGYGYAEPSVQLNVKNEVSGKVSFIHPDLKTGASFSKDTLVLRIEPTTFEFGVSQSQASLSASQSALEQLGIERESTRRQLEIARKNLQVGEAELARVETIFARKLVSQSTVDAEAQKVLSLQQQFEDLEGKLAAYDSREAEINAEIARSASVVTQSEDTLERTEIRLPVDARIGDIQVEADEFVPAGTVLFDALGIENVEIDVELSMAQFRPLLTGFTPTAVNLSDAATLRTVSSALQLDVDVALVGDQALDARWQGQLEQISAAIDPTRNTLGLLVSVSDPYGNIIPGKRPPLIKGMYLAVTFTAPAIEAMVIPRSALHEGRVYVADEQSQLAIKPVDIDFIDGESVVLLSAQSALQPGDRIITSDVIPLIPGMPLTLSADVEVSDTADGATR